MLVRLLVVGGADAIGFLHEMGCYTIEHPFLYMRCVRIKKPKGVDSEMLEGVKDGDASTPEMKPGTTTEPDSEPDDGFLPGQAENGLLRPGQIHG